MKPTTQGTRGDPHIQTPEIPGADARDRASALSKMGGSNSKADLADILVALAQNDVSPDAHDFWDELWKLDTTAEDVFELITPEDVRHLRRERPENVVTLFTQATAQLCQIVHTPVPMYFGQALNCMISVF